jgi:uncharacterized protein (TIGR03083 family)
VGRVHHWAAANVERARPEPLTDEEAQAAWGAMPADAEVVAWYRTARQRLMTALAAAPPDLSAWTFLPNSPPPRAFWARRQAHELTVHRADAEAVTGPPTPVTVAFAVDGIDELLFGFYSRPRSRLRSPTPRTFSVRTDSADWLVHIGLEGAWAERSAEPGECTVRGSEGDVYFALWNRRPLHDLYADGDRALIDLWQGNATVRWS